MNATIGFDDDTIRKIFGHEAAEDEDIDRLREYYFKSSAYKRMQSTNPLRILIGHKGIGKSALLSIAHDEDIRNNKYSIILRPDDIYELPPDSLDLNKTIRAWKEGLFRIIRDKIMHSILNIELSDYDTTTTYSWSTFFTGLSNVVKTFLEKQGISLEEMQRDALNTFIAKKEINIYIDDLDRGWNASPESITRMSALLNSLRDISRDYKGIRFVISIRSDVFFLVRTSDESTDKLESACIWFSWDNHEILAMLIKRIKNFFQLELQSDDKLIAMDQAALAYDLNRVMDERFNGKGKWENIPTYRMLMTLIRRRPRDLVKLCTLAAREASDQNHSKILSDDFNQIFETYSRDRLQDTINEYKTELPRIQELLENMKPSNAEFKSVSDGKKEKVSNYSSGELIIKIKNILSSHNLTFYGKQQKASPQDLIAFMYKIGFITANKKMDDGKIDRRFFEEQNYLSSKYSDFGYNWEIHPAYRWALSPSNSNILDQID